MLQVQQKLRESEGVDAYTDATPLRLLPCDTACQSAKVSLLDTSTCFLLEMMQHAYGFSSPVVHDCSAGFGHTVVLVGQVLVATCCP